MKYTYYIILAILVLCSCADEHDTPGNAQRLNITFADEPTQSRSIWEDQTGTENPKVVYRWTSGTDMLTAIKHDGRYVPFYDDLAATPQYHSATRFETIDAERSKIKLQTERGVKYYVAAGSYVYPVAVGDKMYCCHPINEHTTVNSSADAVTVDMHLPQTFTYTERTNDLSSLKEYSYVYTTTTLQSVNASDVVANASHFNSACAIIRFNITNNVTSAIDITRIKIEADNGAKIFPDVLRFSDGAIAEQGDKANYSNSLTTNIQNVSLPQGKDGVFYNMCFPLDGNFNGALLRFTIDTNYLTYRLRLNSNFITNHKFEAGKIYTFNFTLDEKEIHLNMIEIAQCTTYNVDNTESLNVIIAGDVPWSEADNATAQMVFVSLGMTATIADKEYEVLWATCNLGAMEPIETGFHYAWGEVNRKASSEYSPTGYTAGAVSGDISGTEFDPVQYYLGGGFWLWRMPTKEMWQALITDCTWTWKTVKKVSDGTESEENLNFDASVWEVTKRDSDNKLIGHIYLPITGYSGWDGTSYTKVNKALCYYWTSTPEGTAAGAEEEAWAFETTYYTEEGSGLGHMTAPALVKKPRYNGYAIRPVLLKEK
ncbi:MAG: hypothetical protein ACI4AM_10420 [Muribaculaceae bacterium]